MRTFASRTIKLVLNPSLQCFAPSGFGGTSIVKIDIKISFLVLKDRSRK
jgi:hypothetical protein